MKPMSKREKVMGTAEKGLFFALIKAIIAKIPIVGKHKTSSKHINQQ